MEDKKLLNLIKTKKWRFYVTRKFNWFVQNTQILTNRSSTLKKHIGFDCSQDNYLILNGDEYYTDEEAEKFNSVFERNTREDSRFFSKFAKKAFKIVEKINKYIEKLQQENYSKSSHKQLARAVSEFQKIYTHSFVPAFSRPDDYLEEKVKQLLKSALKASIKKSDEIFSKIATYPNLGKLSYTDEPLELLKIAKSIKDGGYNLNKLPSKISKKLDKHIDNYSWIKGSIFVEDVFFSKEEYIERIENMLSKDVDKEIQRIETVRKNDQKNYKKLFMQYKFNDELKRITEAVRNFIFLRTHTTEASDKLFYVARRTLLKEAAKRLGLSSEEVVTLSSDEIVGLLQGELKNAEKAISNRNRGYAIVWINGQNYTLFDSKAVKLQKLVADTFKGKVKKKRSTSKIIKGTPASLGRAVGVVKVLLSHKEVDKVNTGNILVASMTTPDYVMAMEKAAAFVTDEGGITCHAAIVAREFGVPCIVGTGNATSLLKDGDIVEVNANRGIVAKLD